MSSGPPCHCGEPSVHVIVSEGPSESSVHVVKIGDGEPFKVPTGRAPRPRYVCGDEECEWQVHCFFLGLPYQGPATARLPL